MTSPPTEALSNRSAQRLDGFWADKRVLVTGHTGFKGGWLTLWLSMLGARVSGYSLPPSTDPSLYSLVSLTQHLEQNYLADVRDFATLAAALVEVDPQIILHLAAQPLVRNSYADPLETYSTNVMGTVNLLQAARQCESLESIVVVTSDKCYENKGWHWGYRETDELGGYDPYSSSKACQELVVSAFRQSFFQERAIPIATARAGNVIGGGDWSEDRLIPDAMRAHESGKTLTIRSPLATRPWQHVLEPLAGYLELAEKLCSNPTLEGPWNFGPRETDVRTVEEVLTLVSARLPGGFNWQVETTSQPHEAKVLKLDYSKAASFLTWKPKWTLEQAVERTAVWYGAARESRNLEELTMRQIEDYCNPTC